MATAASVGSNRAAGDAESAVLANAKSSESTPPVARSASRNARSVAAAEGSSAFFLRDSVFCVFAFPSLDPTPTSEPNNVELSTPESSVSSNSPTSLSVSPLRPPSSRHGKTPCARTTLAHAAACASSRASRFAPCKI